MADPVRVAVVGSGYFGRFHADHYSRNKRAELVAVIDTDEERARAVAAEFGGEASSDYRSIIGRVDAASVAVPTPLHYDVARELIEAGIHVLVEKPLTDSVESGRKLADLADARKRMLQVGHIERFSSAYRTLAKIITDPLYFESYRIAPWKNRGVEVDVILDLMIHDIDMIIGLVDSPVAQVDAVGTPVLGKTHRPRQCPHHLRIGLYRQRHRQPGQLQDRAAHARVCAQPISELRSRRGADLRLPAARRSDDRRAGGHRHRDIRNRKAGQSRQRDRRLSRLCRRPDSKPLVDGQAGCEALRVASLINESIEEHLKTVQDEPPAARAGLSRAVGCKPSPAGNERLGSPARCRGRCRARPWRLARSGDGMRSPSALTTSLKACRCLARTCSEPRISSTVVRQKLRRAIFLQALRHHLAAREQIHQGGVLDADPHAAHEKGRCRADPVGHHHRHIGKGKLERHGARFGHGGIGGGEGVEAFGHVDDQDRRQRPSSA